jgi:hypothetical protein
MELTGIPKEVFTSCFQDLQKRWQQCIDWGGNYFEGAGSIGCEVEFCIFYRLILRTLRTKDVFTYLLTYYLLTYSLHGAEPFLRS